jgi:alcohol dehydrogenase class IV
MTTNKENWGYPNTVWFGDGRIKDLSKACEHLNIRKPLLVTDKGFLIFRCSQALDRSLILPSPNQTVLG